MKFGSRDKKLLARSGQLPYGYYWIRLNDFDGTMITVGRYRKAYSWEGDDRNRWDICGDCRPRIDTVNPDASNAIDIGDFIGEMRLNV